MGSPGSRAVGPPPDPGLLSLYDRALPEVYGYLLSRCGQRALAEDLTAETFLAAVRAGDVPISVGWLIGTARHKLVDHWRRLEREDRGLRLLDGGRTDTEDPWDAELDALRARQVLDRLGPAHRAALVLRYLDDLTVAQVAEALGGETLPPTGPSFRDATRVAGSNPPLWAQIYSANRAALGAQIDDLVRRLGEARALLDTGGEALEAWQASAGRQRRALLEVGLAGGDGAMREIRMSVPNRPGVVADVALALSRAGVNISDMALHPSPDGSRGAIRLWVAADRAAAARDVLDGLGLVVT